jgi:ubiquinone/menaquinone biosynthesis C-methylase UbiE
MKDESVKKAVREGYARIAKQEASCCGGATSAKDISRKIGYTEEELRAVPEGANLGLGCGNPVALSSLQEGETVLDLGSGAGFDCFLAASRVGPRGRVIGVDMTPEMIDKARDNARKGKFVNVEFRLGEIENLPAGDGTVHVVISNCVINLAPDKRRVFREAFRVLKPGGRLMISDIVLLKELPDYVRKSVEAYIGCVSGAVLKDEYIQAIKAAGFERVKIVDETSYPLECITDDPSMKKILRKLRIPIEEARDIANSITSVKISGIKPG